MTRSSSSASATRNPSIVQETAVQTGPDAYYHLDSRKFLRYLYVTKDYYQTVSGLLIEEDETGPQMGNSVTGHRDGKGKEGSWFWEVGKM